MHIAVYDTWVKRPGGVLMHFDILVPATTEPAQVYRYGDAYLREKNLPGVSLRSNRCEFCHLEEPTAEVLNSINSQGYHIIEMAGCDTATVAV